MLSMRELIGFQKQGDAKKLDAAKYPKIGNLFSNYEISAPAQLSALPSQQLYCAARQHQAIHRPVCRWYSSG